MVKSIIFYDISANNNKTIQTHVKGWKTIQDKTNYTIKSDGKYVKVHFHHPSDATVPKFYEYSLPNDYYPSYNVAAISSTIGDNGIYYATFSATTSGTLTMKLRQNTYGSSVNAVYGMLLYPL